MDGLWERNGRFYVQVHLPGKGCRRVPLLDEHNIPVSTVSAAVVSRNKLLADKARGQLPGPRIAPPFNEYVKHYAAWMEETGAKSLLTIQKEKSALRGWAEFLGAVRLTQITRKQVNDYALQRKGEGVSPRTINLDVIALANCLRFAKEEGFIRSELPTAGWKPLKYTPPRRSLIPDDAVDRLVAAALAKKEDGTPKYLNGQLMADYIRLLAYSGARRMAGLRARWEHVDFANRQITFITKYDKRVVVDFNPLLEAHLKDMHARREDPDEPLLFPSPRPGDYERNMTTPTKSFHAIRQDAGLPDLRLHDLRHWFISWAVMNGIDTMTIASWVGHSDGGVLIGKVYGHLDPKHKRSAAEKLTFAGQKPAPAVSLHKDGPAENLVTLDLSKVTVADLLGMIGKSGSTSPEAPRQTDPVSSSQPSDESTAVTE